MAEKKFSQLTAKAATIADTDLVAISESAGGGTYVSKSVTGANIKALVTDANLVTSDITTNNVSTAKHGFVPKAPNDATQFLDGTGAFDTVKDSDLSTSDITTNNVSITKHGFAPKAPNDATQFLDGTGAYDTVKDTDLSLSDNTTNNVSAARHGFVPKLPNNTTTFLRGDGTFAAPAAGGLTYFTEAQSTAAPNATVNVDSLTAVASTTNADIALVPKGTGALLTAIPDNTTTGGNKRGTNAIDLQSLRLSAANVASGANSFVVGAYNTASGSSSTAVGYVNTASNSSAFAAGSGNTASGSFSSVFGENSIASGTQSFAAGGLATASGTASVALSSGTASAANAFSVGNSTRADGANSIAFGNTSQAFGIDGRLVHGRAIAGNWGETQKSTFIIGVRTTGNTATTLTSGGGAASATNQVILSNQSAYGFTGTIIGKQSGSTNAVMWKVEGLIARGANAASTVLTTSTVTLVSNAPAWGTPTLAADANNGGLRVQVTGAAATNIQWTAVIETTEVIYA